MTTTSISLLNNDCLLQVLHHFSVVDLLSMPAPTARIFPEGSIKRNLSKRQITTLRINFGYEVKHKAYMMRMEITERCGRKGEFVIKTHGHNMDPPEDEARFDRDQEILSSAIIFPYVESSCSAYIITHRRKTHLMILKLLNAVATHCDIKDCLMILDFGIVSEIEQFITEGVKLLELRRTIDGIQLARIKGICVYNVQALLPLLEWFNPSKVFTLHWTIPSTSWNFLLSDSFAKTDIDCLFLANSRGFTDTHISKLKSPTIVLKGVTKTRDAIYTIVQQWLKGEREIHNISFNQRDVIGATAFRERFISIEVQGVAGYKDWRLDDEELVVKSSLRTFLLTREDGVLLQVVIGMSTNDSEVIRMAEHPVRSELSDPDLVNRELVNPNKIMSGHGGTLLNAIRIRNQQQI